MVAFFIEKSISKVLYISELTFITSYYLYSWLLIIFKLMMLIKSGILLKNHVSCLSYAKILHHIFVPTIYSRTNWNFETCMPVWFEQKKELKQFWGTLTR